MGAKSGVYHCIVIRCSLLLLTLSSVFCLSVTIVSPAKTAEPIEMSFGLWTPVHPSSHVVDAGPDPPSGFPLTWKTWKTPGIL